MQTGQHNVYSCDYDDDFCKSFQMYFASKFSFTLNYVHTESLHGTKYRNNYLN